MRFTLGEEGLTLLEALVAAMLLSLIMIGSLLLYERGVRTWSWVEQEAEVVDNLRIAVDMMVYDVRVATRIAEPPEGESSSVLTVYQNSAEVTYKCDASGELERNSRPLTTPVITAVYFSRPSEALVKIELKGKGRRTAELSVRTAVYACALSQ